MDDGMVMFKTSCDGNTKQKYWSTPVQEVHKCEQEKKLTSELKNQCCPPHHMNTYRERH
jgi:hypothetical protein